MVSLSVPANGPMSDPFGPRSNVPGSPFHHGQDIGFYTATRDFRVFAAAPGTVTGVFWDSALGNSIEITHADGSKTGYHHLADSGLVAVGQTVVRRQHIGTEGATGTAAVVHGVPQTHLHFVYWVNGVRVDPARYWAGTAGNDTQEIEDDMAFTDAHAYMLEQVSAALLGKIGDKPVALNPDVNFGQSVIYGLQEARKGIQKIIDTPAGSIDVQVLATALAPLLKPGATVADIEAALAAAADRVIAAVPTAVQNGAAARTAIVK